MADHEHETSDYDSYDVDEGRTVTANLSHGFRKQDIEVSQVTVFDARNSAGSTLRMTVREARELFADLSLIINHIDQVHQGRSYPEIQAIVERKREERVSRKA